MSPCRSGCRNRGHVAGIPRASFTGITVTFPESWVTLGRNTPHPWTQELVTHLHVHAVMACGVLAQDGSWSTPARKPDFLFPVPALSKVFRGKFMAALTKAHQDGSIKDDPQGQRDAWAKRQRQLYKHRWVVYAKTPLSGPAQTLEYLSRYTHRTGISNERIKAVSYWGQTLMALG